MSLTRVLLLTLPVAFTRYKGCEEWCQNRCSELNGPVTIECGKCDDTMSCYPGASDFSSHHGETKVYNEERQGETRAYYQRAVNARPIPMAASNSSRLTPLERECPQMATLSPSSLKALCKQYWERCGPLACASISPPEEWAQGACNGNSTPVRKQGTALSWTWSAADKQECARLCLTEGDCHAVSWDRDNQLCTPYVNCTTTIGTSASSLNVRHRGGTHPGERSALLYPELQESCLQTGQRVANVTRVMPLYRDALTASVAIDCLGRTPGGCEPEPPTPCESPSCSAFSRVVILILATHPERVSQLLAYKRWFLDLAFLVLGRKGCATCNEAVGLSGETARCVCLDRVLASNTSEGQDHLTKNFDALPGEPTTLGNLHGVFSQEMLRLARGHKNAVGAAYMHADFVLSPRHFSGAPLGDIWTPRSGNFPGYSDPCCFRVAGAAANGGLDNRRFRSSYRNTHPHLRSLPGGWGWYSSSKMRCMRAVEGMGAEDCCFGWSDFVYVPSVVLPSFSKLLSEGPFRQVFHEVAVPTVLALLVRRRMLSSSFTAVRWRTLPRCQGYSSGTLEREQLTSITYCAHKLNLNSSRHQAVLRRLLAA